jgi:hypothetical protein
MSDNPSDRMSNEVPNNYGAILDLPPMRTGGEAEQVLRVIDALEAEIKRFIAESNATGFAGLAVLKIRTAIGTANGKLNGLSRTFAAYEVDEMALSPREQAALRKMNAAIDVAIARLKRLAVWWHDTP